MYRIQQSRPAEADFGNAPTEPRSMLEILRDRERGGRSIIVDKGGDLNISRIKYMERDFVGEAILLADVPFVKKKVDAKYSMMHETVSELREAMDSGKYRKVKDAIKTVMENLLQAHSNPEDVLNLTPQKSEQRQIFLALGGIDELLRLFKYPFGDKGNGLSYVIDSREFSNVIYHHTDLFNDVLIILREIVFSVPRVADSSLCTKDIAFLFALLSHEGLFQHGINLIEEVLAARYELFSLENVPQLYRLVEKMNVRQFAHFMKVLGILLFEPEDKLFAEGQIAMRGMTLLSLRHERLIRPDTVVERNQTLIIETPGMLEKMILILKLVNYGPNIGDIVDRSIILEARCPIPDDLMKFKATSFEDFKRLISIAKQEQGGDEDSDSNDDPPLVIEEDITPKLIDAFAPITAPEGDTSRMNEINTISNIMGFAISLKLGTPTRSGTQLLLWVAGSGSDNEHAGNALQILMQAQGELAGTTSATDSHLTTTTTSALNELKFHSLLLSPHQVEILVVLCTLLSGRRKVEIQQTLADADLARVLLAFQSRMSWDQSKNEKAQTFAHAHGPGCECNPGSALRLQYLRLVHSFYDGDYDNNKNKKLVLSKSELRLLHAMKGYSKFDVAFSQNNKKGLINQLIAVHAVHDIDPPYMYWVTLCLESYARGSTGPEQTFLLRSGILSNILKVIKHDKKSTTKSITNVMQTQFDLLSELMRHNIQAIELLNSTLTDKEFKEFMETVMNNLTESNVFLSTLYMTLEEDDILQVVAARNDDMNRKKEMEIPAYLTHSWYQFSPKTLSKRGITSTRALEVKENVTVKDGVKLRHRVGGATELGSVGALHTSKVVYKAELSAAPAKTSSTLNDVPTLEKMMAKMAVSSEVDNENEDSLGTPPESPDFNKFKQIEKELDTLYANTLKGEEQKQKQDDKVKISTYSDGEINLSSGWSLSDELFRIAMFLINERDNILMRLMDIMSVHTVNHENVCVLNSLLKILLIVHRRGQLPTCLNTIRRLADERVSNIRSSYDSDGDISDTPCENNLVGGEALMLNFRRLLWFWREFYLRRGRDRLSLEYTTHVPFKFFQNLVDLLCADNGVPTSLLKAPTNHVMPSPYFGRIYI
jgi:hypothetical protein